jgi:MinD-like ATPase involved in chromosome partitioning or flagellar assembly
MGTNIENTLEKGINSGPEIFSKENKIVFFSGVKGGCGCSFIVNCAAAYLARTKSKNIVLFDLNNGKRDSRVIFNLADDSIRDIGDLDSDFKDIDISVLKRLVVNLDNSLNLVLPSLKFEKKRIFESGNLELFFDILGKVFDLILVDFPFYLLSKDSFDFLEYPDKFVLISQPDLIAVSNLEILIKNLCPEKITNRFVIVINKFNIRPYISPSRIINIIKYPIDTFIPYDRDIEYLYLTRGPFPIFKYNLRIVKSMGDFSENLYNCLF